ncbi:MAG: hypothetical protein ACI8S3_000749, partial [Alphaproteobacteria bacterium]
FLPRYFALLNILSQGGVVVRRHQHHRFVLQIDSRPNRPYRGDVEGEC